MADEKRGIGTGEMEKIIVRRLRFGSYVKLFLLGGLSLGAFVGLVMFIIALFGGPVNAYIGSYQFSGIGAGAFSLILAPAACGIIAAVFAAMMYLPFTLIIRLLKGIELTAEIGHTNNSNTEII